jgi:hypothetical protein
MAQDGPAAPVPAGLLTRVLHDFVRAAGRRRTLPTVLHLGHPYGELVAVPEQDWYDAAARADLVTRALDGLEDPAPLAWLTRAGTLAAEDVDLHWCAAVQTGYARHGLPLSGFYLITRTGWCDLIGGARQQWYRVRPNRQVG